MTHRPHSSVRYVPMTHRPHSSVGYVLMTHRPHSSVRYVLMTHRPHSSVRYVPMTHRPHSSVRYVLLTHRPHSSVRYVPMTHRSVRYVPTAVCSCRILSRVWRRIRKATKLTRTVLLFILRPNASFTVLPSYTLVCALVTVSVCPLVDFFAGLYIPCCGFMYALLRGYTISVAGFSADWC